MRKIHRLVSGGCTDWDSVGYTGLVSGKTHEGQENMDLHSESHLFGVKLKESSVCGTQVLNYRGLVGLVPQLGWLFLAVALYGKQWVLDTHPDKLLT